MSKKISLHALAAALCCASALSTPAGAAEQDAARLGADLTPVGAEKAGNKEGSIPAYGGTRMPPPTGWKVGAKPVNPYAGEKPLYVIEAGNIDKYKDKLSDGQQALVKTMPGYRMEVYPAHRSCGYPDFVAEQTKKNLSVAKLDAENGLADAVGGGIPFPLPKSGAEAIWNHKLRYNGESIDTTYTQVVPPKGASGKNIGEVQVYHDQLLYPMASAAVKSAAEVKGVEFGFREQTLAPSSVAGDGVQAYYFLDKPTEVNLYFSAQRRMRRAPTYQYDAPVLNTDNLATIDQAWMFNGLLDRYDFKLAGKRELLIPYNNFPLYDHTLQAEDVYAGNYMARDKVRYELHRVWVVEATIKAGKRHSMPKRTFYIDEDSWTIVTADLYDNAGKLWRSQEAYLVPEYALGACYLSGTAIYDVQAGRYMAANVLAGAGKPTTFSRDYKLEDFSVDAVRRWVAR